MKNNEITHNDLIEFIKTNKKYLCGKFHLSKIGVFGSFARNEQTASSDIDLIIELEENTQNIYELKIELRNYFKQHLNKNIDIAREKYLKPGVKAEILKDVLYV